MNMCVRINWLMYHYVIIIRLSLCNYYVIIELKIFTDGNTKVFGRNTIDYVFIWWLMKYLVGWRVNVNLHFWILEVEVNIFNYFKTSIRSYLGLLVSYVVRFNVSKRLKYSKCFVSGICFVNLLSTFSNIFTSTRRYGLHTCM